MIISILSLFSEIFKPVFSSSIIARAQAKKILRINLINIREYAFDKHHSVDDKPYGGGVGMILRVDVVYRALQKAKKAFLSEGKKKNIKEKIILLDPDGAVFSQGKAEELSKYNHLILICGHYEGIDDRIKKFVDESISIGNYILTGGEIPAMIITDAVTRLLPNVLSKKQAIIDESFAYGNLLEAPQYTRPRVFRNLSVPKILLSGNHQKIIIWKKDKMKKIKF